MAYAALVSLEQTIDKLLHHHDQYSISFLEKQQFISTNKYITFLKTFLEDYPGKANSLEGRIRDGASQAEDTIEYFLSKQIRGHYISKSTAGPESAKFSQLWKNKFIWLQGKKGGIYTRLRLYFNLKKFKKMVREATQIKNSTTTEDAQLSNEYSSVATSSSRLIAPTSKDGAMVGLDDNLMAIKARLCGESSKLQVIPIFGMGGIGKTTLARNAYADPLSVQHFDIRAWVTVSQDYSAQEILSTLLVSMKVERSGQSNESIQDLVYKGLMGRRYLIVMDDIWSTKAWDDVKMIFPDDHNGSRIILTTRLLDVAAYPDSCSPVHEMQFMDTDQSWNLLQNKVFGRQNCPLELETIGKAIARSCRGLPLAIVVIAGLLRTIHKNEESWENVAKNLSLAISTANEELPAKIISLSYIHLPYHLRPCFLYMGGFKEDYEIRVCDLIKLWVAEGFLKPRESKCLEEVAEGYVEDLVKRSLVLVSRRKANGKIKSCSIHDLVRVLCIRKAEEEKFFINVLGHAFKNSIIESTKNHHRISIDFSELIRLKNVYCSSIHTIICFHLDKSSLSLGSFGNFRLLRVLDVISTTNYFQWFITPEIPAEVFELIHLRYLAFSSLASVIVPPSILNLQNLQTLIIHRRKTLQGNISRISVCLPMEIWRMPQLRHLIFIGSLPTVPRGAPNFPLESLQTLSGVNDFKCTEEILKMIPNLKKLGIIYRTEVYVQDIHLDNFVHLRQLEKLKLEVYSGSILGKLNPVFPTTLKKLTLVGLRLPWEDMSIVGSLPNLEVLKLIHFACHGDKWETSEGEFPRLKFLLIDELEFRLWITENSHFPRLKCLVLYGCQNLFKIPDGIAEIPTLELIEVGRWNKLLVMSAKQIQEEQRSLGNDALQVRVGVASRK